MSEKNLPIKVVMQRATDTQKIFRVENISFLEKLHLNYRKILLENLKNCKSIIQICLMRMHLFQRLGRSR